LQRELKKRLRARAHALKPVVITGQAGVSAAVLTEIDKALENHRLIKLRLNAAGRAERQQMAALVCSRLGAELVQSIGHIVTLFRDNTAKSE
jgi:RNA-binding protein